jgi:hypothetical protein
VTRVLIGDFGELARAGVEDLLRSAQMQVIHSDGDLIGRLMEARPDAVVLNLDDVASVEIAGRISTLFPAMTVIACSAKDPMMRVFPRFHHGESYISSLQDESLAAATHG